QSIFLCWLLLGHAVDGAKAPDEVAAVDADNFTIRKEAGDDVERDAIVGIVESGNENEIVGDVKVSVAGGQALSAKDDGAGKWKLNDLELAAVSISGGAEAAQVFLQRLMVRVRAVGFDGGEHGSGSDEAGDIVDVAVRVITLNAAAEPDHLFYP